MNVEVGNATTQGDRAAQEDSFCFTSMHEPGFVEHAGIMAVVADGMGGLAGGGEASHLAVQTMRKAYEHKSAEDSIPDALLYSLGKANKAVYGLTERIGKAGTTLVAAVMHGDGIHWISVGDSRVYLLRDKQLTKLTVEHNFEMELMKRVAREEMTLEEARAHEQRHALTSFLGGSAVKHIDRSIKPLPLRKDDRVMLCSDGLYRTLSDQMIAASLGGKPQDAADRLIREAVGQEIDHQDNATVLIMAQGLSEEGWLARAKQRVCGFFGKPPPVEADSPARANEQRRMSVGAFVHQSVIERSHSTRQLTDQSRPHIRNRFGEVNRLDPAIEN